MFFPVFRSFVDSHQTTEKVTLGRFPCCRKAPKTVWPVAPSVSSAANWQKARAACHT